MTVRCVRRDGLMHFPLSESDIFILPHNPTTLWFFAAPHAVSNLCAYTFLFYRQTQWIWKSSWQNHKPPHAARSVSSNDIIHRSPRRCYKDQFHYAVNISTPSLKSIQGQQFGGSTCPDTTRSSKSSASEWINRLYLAFQSRSIVRTKNKTTAAISQYKSPASKQTPQLDVDLMWSGFSPALLLWHVRSCHHMERKVKLFTCQFADRRWFP